MEFFVKEVSSVAIGDKYNRFTQYLQMKHVEGIDSITLTFPEIEKIWGFPISDSMYRYAWANDKTQSYSVGWMRAGYVVTKCDLPEKKISFCYDQNRADMLLNRESVAHRKKSTGLRVKRPEEVCDYLPITAENLEKYNQLVENDPGYGTDGEIIHNVLSAYPLNNNREIVALKICLIDVTNSTHLGTHRSKISIDELAKVIMDIPDFDKRLSCGDPELINELAQSNGRINLFSFASKYCLYHNKEVYGRDDYSIFDSVVAEALPHYVYGLTGSRIDGWRANFDYRAFADCIRMILDEYGIDIPNRRRKFDLFLWYANRKK